MGSLAQTPAQRDGPSDLGRMVEAFAARCHACHGPDARKGGLRLDDAGDLLSTVFEGEPADSELLRRLELPHGDPEAMPPDGPRVDASAIEATRRWITAGAEVTDLGEELARVRAAREAARAALQDVRRRTGARIEPLPQDRALPPGDARLSVDWAFADVAPDAVRLRALAPIATRVHELILAGTAVADAELESLPVLGSLSRVHLERSSVGDAGVRALLARAPRLLYLNVHSTRVSRELVDVLAAHPTLERAVLFGTAVPAGEWERARGAARAARTESVGSDPFGSRQPRRILAADGAARTLVLLRETTIGAPEVLWELRDVDVTHVQWLGDTTPPHGRILYATNGPDGPRAVERDTAAAAESWSAAVRFAVPSESIGDVRRTQDGSTWAVSASGRHALLFEGGAQSPIRSLAIGQTEPSRGGHVRLFDGAVLVSVDTRAAAARVLDPVRGEDRGAFASVLASPGLLDLVGVDGASVWGVTSERSLVRFGPGGASRSRALRALPDGFQIRGGRCLQRLASGRLVVADLGAGGSGPWLVEAEPDGEIVWSLARRGGADAVLTCFEVVEEAR
ncbi:MAG: c-type cytochrome domain-containing protein [Planctomycetota bacterium]